jgi:hypothetical protein
MGAMASGRGAGKIEGGHAARRPPKMAQTNASWNSHEQTLKCKSARTAIRTDERNPECSRAYEEYSV